MQVSERKKHNGSVTLLTTAWKFEVMVLIGWLELRGWWSDNFLGMYRRSP